MVVTFVGCTFEKRILLEPYVAIRKKCQNMTRSNNLHANFVWNHNHEHFVPLVSNMYVIMMTVANKIWGREKIGRSQH